MQEELHIRPDESTGRTIPFSPPETKSSCDSSVGGLDTGSQRRHTAHGIRHTAHGPQWGPQPSGDLNRSEQEEILTRQPRNIKRSSAHKAIRTVLLSELFKAPYQPQQQPCALSPTDDDGEEEDDAEDEDTSEEEAVEQKSSTERSYIKYD